MPVLLPPEKRSEWLSERALELAAFAAFAQSGSGHPTTVTEMRATVRQITAAQGRGWLYLLRHNAPLIKYLTRKEPAEPVQLENAP